MKNHGRMAGWWAGVWLFSVSAQGASLDISQFIEQVKSQSPQWKASFENRSASELRSAEGGIQYSPTLNVNGSYTDDSRETLFPVLYGTRTTTTELSASVTQLMSWGMNAKLSYTLKPATVIGSSSLQPSPFTSVSGEPRLELTQPLWGNGFGVSTRAQRAATDASNESAALQERLRAKQILVAAELAYWRLAYARRTVDVQTEVLKRSQSLYESNSKRLQMNLIDRSDVLQTQAAYQLRQLDLKTAMEEVRAASMAFNSQRGVEGVDVAETLTTPAGADLLKLEIANVEKDDPATPREDVLAAQAGEVAATSSATVSTERNKPTLDLTFSLGGNGLDSAIPIALAQSWSFQYPYFAFGLKWSMALDVGAQSAVRKAYAHASAAAAFNTQKAVLDSRQEWRDLSRSFREIKTRLKLVEELARLQRDKSDHERDRFRRGRSTTYQVLLFEQDSLQAELGFIRVSSDLLRVYAQLKTFGAAS